MPDTVGHYLTSGYRLGFAYLLGMDKRPSSDTPSGSICTHAMRLPGVYQAQEEAVDLLSGDDLFPPQEEPHKYLRIPLARQISTSKKRKHQPMRTRLPRLPVRASVVSIEGESTIGRLLERHQRYGDERHHT